MLLSEMFGVEREVDFKVKGYESLFKVILNAWGEERLMFKLPCVSAWEPVSQGTLCSVIFAAPAGIIHLPPPLTDEQRTVLMAFNLLGYKYLTTDKGNYKYVYTHKPENGFNGWHTKEGHCYAIRKDANLPEKSLYSLAALSDPEPFDIGKALGVGE